MQPVPPQEARAIAGGARKAIELGYRDFGYLRKDKDLDGIKADPRYKQLLKEFGVR